MPGQSSEAGPPSGQSTGHIELSTQNPDAVISGRVQRPPMLSSHQRDVGSEGNCADVQYVSTIYISTPSCDVV